MATLLLARDMNCVNPDMAEATYGHISTWRLINVADWSGLFCASSDIPTQCNPACAHFDADLSAWPVEHVTDFNNMPWTEEKPLRSEVMKINRYPAEMAQLFTINSHLNYVTPFH